MSDKWVADILEAIAGDNSKAPDNVFRIGKIKSISPLVVEMNGVAISKQIHVNPSLVLLADDNASKIDLAFLDKPVEAKWFDLLKNFHKQYSVQKGDIVIVMQSGTTFYVLTKVTMT